MHVYMYVSVRMQGGERQAVCVQPVADFNWVKWAAALGPECEWNHNYGREISKRLNLKRIVRERFLLKRTANWKRSEGLTLYYCYSVANTNVLFSNILAFYTREKMQIFTPAEGIETPIPFCVHRCMFVHMHGIMAECMNTCRNGTLASEYQRRQKSRCYVVTESMVRRCLP